VFPKEEKRIFYFKNLNKQRNKAKQKKVKKFKKYH